MDAVDSDPWWDQGEKLGDYLNQVVGVVVSILAIFPQLIQPGASDNQRGIDLNPIRPEIGVLKELLETLQIPLHPHIGQIRHHMRHNLIRTILGQGEGLLDSLDGMSSVGVPGDVLVDRLHADFDSGAAVGEHVGEVALLTEVGAGFDCYPDAFLLALLGKLHGLLHV